MRDEIIPDGAQGASLAAGSMLLAAIVIMGMCPAASAAGVVLHEPGYVDAAVAATGWTSGSALGAVAETSAGDLFVVGGYSYEIVRKRPADSGFSIYALLDPTYADVGISVLAYGSDLYVGMASGNILKLDPTAAPGQTPVLVTSIPLPGEVLDLGPPCCGASAVAATSVGVYEVDLATGQFELMHTAAGSPVSSIVCSPTGSSLLGVDFAANHVFELQPGSTWTRALYYSDGATTFRGPDGIAVHPETGDVYVACQGTNTIERFDSSGARLPTFLSGASFDATYYPTALTFSRDGQSLYYITRDPPSVEVRTITGFPLATSPTGGVAEPAPSSSNRSEVEIVLDVDDPAGLPVICSFYYSTDSGVSYALCTDGDCSPLTNPSAPLPTPSLSSRFIWNSYADGVALASATNVELRVLMDNSVGTTERDIVFAVDNSVSVDLTSPICGSSSLGNVELVFDVSSASGLMVVADFEFTSDGGATWTTCSAASSSPLANPSAPLPSPSLSSRFIWNSYADGVALVGSTPIEVRVNVSDGAGDGFSTRDLDLDNTGLTVAIRSPGTGAVLTGEIEILLDADYGLPYGPGQEPILQAPEYSLDGGLTYQPCNGLGTYPSPVLPEEISSTISARSFIWNSIDDAVGLVSAQSVQIRARATQLSTTVQDIVEVTVSNTGCGLMCGDCDFSGFVDVVDSLRAAQYDAGLATLDPEGFRNCNVANPREPRVSVLDALVISRFMVGYAGALDCCP